MPNNFPIHIKNGNNYSGYNFITPKVVDDTEACTTIFTSSDDSTTTETTTDGLTPVSTMTSGETHASLFSKISAMFSNIRKLWNTVGETDISSVGSTVTGAINNLNGKVKGWTYVGTGTSVTLPSYNYSEIFVLQGRDSAPPDASSNFVYFFPKVILPSPGGNSYVIDNGYGQNTQSMARRSLSVSSTSITSTYGGQIAVYVR